MGTLTRLAAFGSALAVVFAASLGAGRLVGSPAVSTPTHGAAGHADDGDHATAPHVPGGLQVSDRGYRLVPLTGALSAGAEVEFRFRIVGPDGQPVTVYTPTHERDLHLIVVRRDLSGFQHLHPELGPDGVWSQPLSVVDAGQYRVFADFRPARLSETLTLGVDVPAAGSYAPRPLPPAATTARVDGYEVHLSGELVPGESSRLALRVTRDGIPVADLQPYLGAYGHLVALRDGDLAYLHVHPDGGPGDDRTAAGPEIVFHAEVPSAGAYRLFLDFRHDDVVRTAEFTAVAGDATTPTPSATNSPSAPAAPSPSVTGHDGQPHGHG